MTRGGVAATWTLGVLSVLSIVAMFVLYDAAIFGPGPQGVTGPDLRDPGFVMAFQQTVMQFAMPVLGTLSGASTLCLLVVGARAAATTLVNDDGRAVEVPRAVLDSGSIER